MKNTIYILALICLFISSCVMRDGKVERISFNDRQIETMEDVNTQRDLLLDGKRAPITLLINAYNNNNLNYDVRMASLEALAESKDKTVAAIASKLSAEIYKLKILKENIEDEKGNVTRFLIMGKNVQQPEYKKDKKYVTTCIFRLKSKPSALYKSLGGFATNQINMTKLESFSVKNTFAQTNFYLDFEGHLDDKLVQNAMEELGFHTESLDILGVYESSKFRQK